MNRILFLLLSLLISNSLKGQKFKYITPSLDDSCVIISYTIDTLSWYEKLVYIDYKKNSPLKKSVADFRLSSSDHQEIKDSYNLALGDDNKSIGKIKSTLPKKWVRLHKFRGKWIFYSDIEFNLRYIFTDSALIQFNMDGKYAKVIEDFEVKNSSYHYKLLEYSWSGIIEQLELKIHIIDEAKSVAVWEFIQNKDKYYLLMISAENIDKFPVVGIVTTDLIGDEHEMFDEIDYEKLINQ